MAGIIRGQECIKACSKSTSKLENATAYSSGPSGPLPSNTGHSSKPNLLQRISADTGCWLTLSDRVSPGGIKQSREVGTHQLHRTQSRESRLWQTALNSSLIVQVQYMMVPS